MINENLTVEVLTRILEHDQQAMERCDSTSFTPLHMYCELNRQVNTEALNCIFDASPQCLTMVTEDDIGVTPVHCYMRNLNVQPDIILLMTEEDPDALIRTCRSGQTAIYRYFGNKVISIPVVDILLALDPEGLTRANTSGNGLTPVHTFFSHKHVTPPAILSILASDPEALLRTDMKGATPVHLYMFCGNVCDDVVETIIEFDPNAMKRTTTSSRVTAVHRYMGNKTVTGSIVNIIQKSDPEAFKRCNKDGGTPLHRYMINSDVRMEVLDAIVRNNPRAILKADKDGLTPFHEYMFENKNVEVSLRTLSFVLERIFMDRYTTCPGARVHPSPRPFAHHLTCVCPRPRPHCILALAATQD